MLTAAHTVGIVDRTGKVQAAAAPLDVETVDVPLMSFAFTLFPTPDVLLVGARELSRPGLRRLDRWARGHPLSVVIACAEELDIDRAELRAAGVRWVIRGQLNAGKLTNALRRADATLQQLRSATEHAPEAVSEAVPPQREADPYGARYEPQYEAEYEADDDLDADATVAYRPEDYPVPSPPAPARRSTGHRPAQPPAARPTAQPAAYAPTDYPAAAPDYSTAGSPGTYPGTDYPAAQPAAAYAPTDYPATDYPAAAYTPTDYTQPAATSSATVYSATDYSAGDYPATDLPDSGGYPASSYPSTDYPSPSYPSTDYPTTSYPSTDYPSTSYPNTDYPSTSYPNTDYPSTSYPNTDYPSTDYPSTNHPSTDYPSTDYPTTSYPSPDYSYPAPSYPTPSYPTPNYPMTDYPAPDYPSPTYPSTNYPAPDYPPGEYAASDPTTHARLVTVASATGGCGKTFFATNSAALLARAGNRVLLVDLDLQFGEVADALRIKHPYSVYDGLYAANGERLPVNAFGKHLDKLVHHHKLGFDVLTAPRDPVLADYVGARDAATVLDAVASRYDVVITDTPPSLNDVVIAALDRSASVIVMATLDVPSLRNLTAFLDVLRRLGLEDDRIELVLNKADTDVGVTVEQANKAFHGRFKSVLPVDRAVSRSVNLGTTVATHEPRAKVSRALIPSIARLGERLELAQRPREAALALPHETRRSRSLFGRLFGRRYEGEDE